jgi:hypothetical protein
MNGRMAAEWWMGKDLRGSGRGLIKIISRNLHQGLGKTTKETLSGYPVTGRDSNLTPPDNKSRTVRLDRPIRYVSFMYFQFFV